VRRFVTVPALLLVSIVGCSKAAARQYGQYTALAPRISPTPNERVPLHVNVDLARAANVAVFLVTPGRGTVLLFPEDSTASARVEAGPHVLNTSYARRVARGDTLARRQGDLPGASTRGPRTGRGGFPGDTSFVGGRSMLTARSFLLVFATDQPISYTALNNRVVALTIPIEDDAALNTVTKLIRDTTPGRGAWAAYATEFTP